MTDNLTPEDAALIGWAECVATPQHMRVAARIRVLSAEVASLKAERDRLYDALSRLVCVLEDDTLRESDLDDANNALGPIAVTARAALEGKL